MNRPPTTTARIAQYAILALAAIFAFYPVWFAILASGRLGNRLYTVNLTTGQASTVGEIGHALCVRHIAAVGQMQSTPVAPLTWGSIKGLYR